MKSILRRLTIRLILATTATVYNKSAKICIGAKKKDRVFRSNSRFDLNDIVTYPREIRKNTPAVLGNVQGTPDIVFRTCKIDKTVFINSTSSLPSLIVSFLFAAKANTNVAQKLLISATDRTRLEMQTRAALKDSKLRMFKPKVFYTISATNDYSNRGFGDWLEGGLSGENNVEHSLWRNRTDV